jgi:cytochrome c biogenesis protein CcmG, thiol:disulfide interchange protein DsbE
MEPAPAQLAQQNGDDKSSGRCRLTAKESAMPVLSQRQWNLLLVTVLVAGSLLIAATRVQQGSGAHPLTAQVDALADPAALPDHPAPDLALPQLDGTSVTLRDLRGQVVLINIWATWCPPCRAEMPAIQQAYTAYRDRGFMVLAVNQREDTTAITPFLEQYGLTFPILLDRDGQASATYQASALPSSLFVDRRGVLRAVYHGPMPARVINGIVEQLLQERP